MTSETGSSELPDAGFVPIGVRINEVRKAIAYIRKDKKVQTYMAVTHDAVTAEIRQHLIDQGILTTMEPVPGESRMLDTGEKTGKGSPIYRFETLYRVHFVCHDRIRLGNEDCCITMTVPAHANDQGDKAPGKAISYAMKYAILKLFNIETGENEESRVEAEPKLITEAQLTHLKDLCKECELDEEILERVAVKRFNIDDITDLYQANFDDACNVIRSIGEKKKARDGAEE